MAVTAGTISGNGVLVYLEGTAIGCTTGGTLTITNNQIETTCKDNDGAITYAAGSQDWNIQVDGNTKLDAPVGLQALAELAMSKETVTVRMATSNTSDDPYFEGDAFVSSFSWTNPVNAPSTYSVTFTPRGPLSLFNS
jgi:predicted secreted protein